MKKIILTLALLCLPLALFGCQKKETIEGNMSEITKIYYSGESADGGLYASICVGLRENPYIIDGKHTSNCDFSLISLKFAQQKDNKIDVSLKINGSASVLALELNPANHIYMADLGYALSESDEIELEYQSYSLKFENISKSFETDYQCALNLAKDALKDEIQTYYDGNSLQGECYLKILTEQNGENELFWIFTIVGQNNKSNNVVINVQSGEILLKN